MATGAVPTIDDTTNDESPLENSPTNEGGTVQQSLGDGEMVVGANIQLTSPEVGNMFQEVNMFIGEVARVYAIGPAEARVRLMLILQAMSHGSDGVVAS
jgi:hypothetical protein